MARPKGIPQSEEWKQEQSKRFKGRDNSAWIGKSIATRKQRIKEGKIIYHTGEKSRNWKGGKCQKNQAFRMTKEYKIWRSRVFERDNWTCQTCQKRGGIIEAHHIKPFIKYPELRVEINNGVTLCKECHRLIKK